MLSLVGGQVADYHNNIFHTGPSFMPVKRGAIRFLLKEDNPWGLMVNPEFEIVLTDPDKESKISRTTVFGGVMAGMEIVELISQLPADNQNCTIAECGLI